MSRAFAIHWPERAYTRRGLFALELLDPVTLSRVTDGVRVRAEGLRAIDPSVSSGGLFVWLDEDVTKLVKVSIDPQMLPFDRVERLSAELHLPPATSGVTTIELPPRVDYPFAAGTTAARGTLIEERVLPPQVPTPVLGADVRLQWLDEDGVTWNDAPTTSRTNSRGDFVVVLRLAADEVPQVDANGGVTVRLSARRGGTNERQSDDFKLPQGRVADPTTLNTLIFAWDELHP
jgi:hypothetical protein